MISCILATMDRTNNLIKILPSWAEIDNIKEIIICDWGSKKPIYKNGQIKEFLNKYKKIKVIRIDNEIYYYRCNALNLAFQFTSKAYPLLLKIDADYMNINCNDNFFKSIYSINFLDKHYCNGDDNSSEYGLLITKKQFFEELQGYNENFKSSWGFEDVDLYRRLGTKLNLERFILKKMIRHIPHSNSARFLNQEIKSKDFNIGISESGKTWQMQKYEIIEEDEFYLKVKKYG